MIYRPSLDVIHINAYLLINVILFILSFDFIQRYFKGFEASQR